MLDAKKFGLAGGILWGFSMFFCTVLAIFTGYGSMFLNLMASIYPGYTISWVGSFIGMLYGFVDAFIALYVLGWLYNKLEI